MTLDLDLVWAWTQVFCYTNQLFKKKLSKKSMKIEKIKKVKETILLHFFKSGFLKVDL
jgi:hypothetical protein